MKKLVFMIAIAACFFAGCKTTRVEISNETTEREIIQIAQTAYDKGLTDDALYYYNVLLQRYGMNNDIYVEGRYEIAHIYVKEKDYSQAVPILEELLDMYANAHPGQLPPRFYRLAQNDYNKIPESKKRTNSAE